MYNCEDSDDAHSCLIVPSSSTGLLVWVKWGRSTSWQDQRPVKLFSSFWFMVKAEGDWLLTVIEIFSWKDSLIIFYPTNATRKVESCGCCKLHLFSQTLLLKLSMLTSVGLHLPGPFSCTSWYLPPVWHIVDKLTQTMPSPQFYTDYRHLTQINKQNHAMQLMFIFFKGCICREKDCYKKNPTNTERI